MREKLLTGGEKNMLKNRIIKKALAFTLCGILAAGMIPESITKPTIEITLTS